MYARLGTLYNCPATSRWVKVDPEDETSDDDEMKDDVVADNQWVTCCQAVLGHA